MCGIVGALALESKTINVDFAKSMADKIAHRGPDDAGYLCFHTGAKESLFIKILPTKNLKI